MMSDLTIPTLSGWERRRADLARVLVQRTPVVLLDEPTAALDVHHQGPVHGGPLVVPARGRIQLPDTSSGEGSTAVITGR